MANVDPRMRAKPSILFGGEDAMDEDEVLPEAPTMIQPQSVELISTIITPSPFQHHITGPTSSRFRNALGRITSHPTSDVEAWQALITEVNACYRTTSKHSLDAETQLKLDWMESCYGTLLKYFPYSTSHYVTIVEMLLAQSARVGEDEGPIVDYGLDTSQRTMRCQQKVQHIFETVLGIYMDGSSIDESEHQEDTENSSIGGMCTSSVELWLLYIRTRIRDAHRQASQMPASDAAELARKWGMDAYELAINHAASSFNNHLLWKQYLTQVKSWLPANTNDPALQQKQMIQLRSIYQRLVAHPMTGLDQFWQEYEAFERSQSEALAQALLAEYSPKYQHARTVYLERNRVIVQDLQLTKFATPTVQADEDDYAAKMEEEHQYLALWKKRAAYERTNPERLSPTDLGQRIRQAFKEMACVLTRHPEVWHMWSMWELHSKEPARAQAVLQLGQAHIPDCTLLAFAEAQLVELHTPGPSQCLYVMEQFLERSPNTLGFVLYQQMVRRYKGIAPARAVFSKARRVLLEATALKKETDKDANAVTDAKEEEPEGDQEATTEAKENGKRWMVTNRLDPSVGVAATAGVKKEMNLASDDQDGDEQKVKPGPITWQLYASHATIEHRLNKSPDIAARVYELGLRKHVSFLTKPPYVMKYAQLLLELQDTVNLRALLTRSVAACEAQGAKGSSVAALWDMTLRFESLLSGADPSNVSAMEDVERRRWAALMGPDVEDVASGGIVGGDAVGIGAHKSTIAEQLVRSDGYDVSSSIVNGMSRAVDVLDVMGLWGDGGSGATGASGRLRMQQMSKNDTLDDEMSGGRSDASYQRRLHFQSLAAAGIPAEAAMGDGNAPGSKMLSARERLHQGGAAGAGAGAQNTAVAMAIQQSPDWLRPMLLLLPASQTRSPVLSKPPPHLTEMALTSLRQNNLPAERPRDDKRSSGMAGSKHKLESGGGDSSDEENGGAMGSGGYGTQFRARQRARQMASGQNGMG